MDSLYLESSSGPESFTTSPVRATKKRQKEDFADQQNMNKDFRLQTEGYQQNSHLRKKKKKRHEGTILVKDTHSSKDSSDPADPLEKEDEDDLLRKTPEKPRKKKRRHEVTHNKDSNNGKEPSNETVQLDQEDVDDLLGKTPSETPRKKKRRHEATHDKDTHKGKEPSNETVQLDQEDDIFCEKATLKKKKKKKRDKQGETEDNITSKNDASGRNAEEVNVTMELENQKSKSNKKRKECVRERKKTDATACSNCDEEAVVSTQRTRLRKRMKSEGAGDEELVRHRVQIGTKHLKKKFAKENSKRVDEQLMEKLRQFVPNVDLKSVQDVAKMINYDLPRYIEFRRRGITLNTGRFTAKENQILRKNVEDFMALTGIDSATKLFFTDRFKEEEERITKLKRQHRFFASIANGIPRPSHRIYNRGRRIFDGRNYKGQFTKREIHALLKFHKLYGNDWKKISDLTGRSAFSLQKRFAQFTTKEGAWSKKENQRLLRAVQDYVVRMHVPGGTRSTTARVRRDVLYKSLPWQDIAAKVKTRSWSKCREKWMSILTVKMSHGAVLTSRKKQDVKIKLIKAMYEMQVEDIAHVDWEDLTAVVGNVPPSYVQKKWNALKMCYVPDWQTKSFADIIDFLYEKVLPNLEEQLKNCKGDEDAEPKHQERYLLSYIFNDIDEEEADDDDDDDNDIDVDISKRGEGIPPENELD